MYSLNLLDILRTKVATQIGDILRPLSLCLYLLVLLKMKFFTWKVSDKNKFVVDSKSVDHVTVARR